MIFHVRYVHFHKAYQQHIVSISEIGTVAYSHNIT